MLYSRLQGLAGFGELAFLKIDDPGLVVDLFVFGVERKYLFEQLSGVLKSVFGHVRVRCGKICRCRVLFHTLFRVHVRELDPEGHVRRAQVRHFLVYAEGFGLFIVLVVVIRDDLVALEGVPDEAF